ncbi:MAG: DUF1007 family protein [Campylobacterota bacterium]|nr:DUF1007 family protein [Campylobacterota bacterium]
MIKTFYITLIFSVSLFAHPHTFLEIFPTINIKNNKTTNIHFKWKMDEMTSSMLIMEFDQNMDGKIDKEENQFIYQNYFIMLGDYNFYTDIKISGKTIKLPKPQNFKATIENNKVCYSFDITENYPIKDLQFDFGDEDFFIAPILKKEFLNIKGATPKIIELDNDFYFGYRLELKANK